MQRIPGTPWRRWKQLKVMWVWPLAVGFMLGSVGCGGATESGPTEPPSNLSYSANPASYVTGFAVTPNTPSSSGGAVESYFVAPALPVGLTFSTSTGVISGTPTEAKATSSYIVTASNAVGYTTASLSITVSAPPPAPYNLTYATNPATYTTGVAITSNLPRVYGGAVSSYSVAPSLPVGLDFNTATGVISGTPTVVTATASYVVTATNLGGSTSASVVITVNAPPPPPSDLAYSTNPATYMKGLSPPANSPSSGGGPVASYSVTPDLPAGLYLDPGSGVISGTPTAVAATASYTVTATNYGGSCSTPVTITVLAPAVVGSSGALSAGGAHACAVLNGGMACWGANNSGQLGNDSTSYSRAPVQVASPTNEGGEALLSAGDGHTCAVASGGAWCWGLNDAGQLGASTADTCASLPCGLEPVQVTGLTSGVTAIATGHQHTCAVVNGGVACWGDNRFGQLGNDTWTGSSVPVQVSGLPSGSGVTAIGATMWSTCAVVSGGVQCWGNNGTGELGTNSRTSSKVPVQASGLPSGSGATAVAGGYASVCAVVNGSAWCWGWNETGQLGTTTTTSCGGPPCSTVPVQVTGLTSGVTAVGAGTYHGCALVSGSAKCWGDNVYGQLGNKTTTASSVPVQVSGMTAAQALAVGANFNCASVSGASWCWGDNGAGQLGNSSSGPLYPSSVPVKVLLLGL